MKKSASFMLAVVACVSLWPTTVARAYTPADIAPLAIVSQPFNITGSTAMRFVLTAPESALLNPTNIVDIQLHRRVANRDSFRSIATGSAQVRVIDTYSTTLRNVPRDDQGRLTVSTTASTSANSTFSLSFSIDGIYPVTVRIRDSATNTVLTSALTFVNKRTDPIVDPVPVTALVRLVAAPSVTSDGTISITDDTRFKVREFIAYIATFSGSLTIYLQPEILSSLAQSTDPADAQLLTNLQDQLRRFSVVTSTFISSDVSMYAATNLDDEFIEQLRIGESTLNRYLPGVTVQRSTWIAEAPVTQKGVQLLRKAGIASVLFTENAQLATSASGPRILLHRPEGRPADYMSLLNVEAGISAVLSTTNNPGGSALVGAHAAAEAIIVADDAKAEGRQVTDIRIVLSSNTGALVPGNALGVMARALLGAPGMSLVDMSAPYLVASDTPVLSLRATDPDSAQQRADDINVLRQALNATVSMIPDDDIRRDTWGHVLAIAESLALTDPDQYFDALGQLLRQTRQAVTLNTPGTITLSGRTSIIRLQLRNNSAAPLLVKIQLSSAKLDLDSPVRTVALIPESTTEIEVPAEALTNGRFPISVTVTTPEGNLDVVARTTITARVNALAGYGQLVSISLLLVLAAWWWSHWRKAKLAGVAPTTVSH